MLFAGLQLPAQTSELSPDPMIAARGIEGLREAMREPESFKSNTYFIGRTTRT
jgi:hypothetical protein